jgi:hypothetical protein
MGDSSETGALMELAAAKASEFLDRLGGDAAAANTRAVLLIIFCRLLRSQTIRLHRLELVGRDVESKASIPSWEDEINMALLLEKLERHLTPESVTILRLRRDGHKWTEIAAMLGTSVPAIKTRFWRDIENAKVTLGIGSQVKPAGRARAAHTGKGKGRAA